MLGLYSLQHGLSVQDAVLVLLVARHGLIGQVGVLNIIAILLNLDAAERFLVAGRRRTAESHRNSTDMLASHRHSTDILASYRYSTGEVFRSGAENDTWCPEAGTDACCMLTLRLV
ncbi:hypothetical protein AJ78_06515 [Emergomyces pasteurianus Ep9510]|uniref:Uncharacterized protein n=1 Tax=Emergomyces pasteurianus Ep9510 TaxID=1447872 RepID=A0A1J9Q9W4_9EURO|nr:hypothetical protein AJ78_06515 [Emergomyces pasteurianus Ep9510]